MQSIDDIRTRTVLITGVTRGLGLAMTHRFIQEGCRVIGCGRSGTEIEALNSHCGSPHEFFCLDVSRDEEIEEWSMDVLNRFGAPDLLINNAAVINRNAFLWELTESEFSQVIDINIKGVAGIIRHFVPAMIENGQGIIVNFSSGWGRSVSPEVAPYCATKWAIEGLSKALAEELPEGMACVPLNPGIIDTRMLRSCFGSSSASYSQPEIWAEKAVPFILGLSCHDNGESLTVPE
ncbi:MAG TPA: SDR family oxidoreductase [Verrucomicrobiales bacterium]|nr:SDR family oxidoreductase [Verrucomicrobiales bacterium]